MVAVLTVTVTLDEVGVTEGVSCEAACAVCATMVRAISSGLISWTGASVACCGASVAVAGKLHARRMNNAITEKNANEVLDDFLFMAFLLFYDEFDYMNLIDSEYPTMGGYKCALDTVNII